MPASMKSAYGHLLKTFFALDALPRAGNIGVKQGPITATCPHCGAESSVSRVKLDDGYTLDLEPGCEHATELEDRWFEEITGLDVDESAVADALLAEFLPERANSVNGAPRPIVVHAHADAAKVEQDGFWSITPTDEPLDPGPISWLVEPLIVQESEHLISGPSGIGKSLFWLRVACELGSRAAWLDKENHYRRTFHRLQAFGPEAYANRPFILDDHDAFSYDRFEKVILPQLVEAGVEVVFLDPMRLFYSDCGVNDTQATGGVDEFKQRVFSPLHAAGIATVALENTGLRDDKRARGDSSKRSNTMLEFSLSAPSEVTPERAGLIELKVEKDRDGVLGKNTVLRYRVGGSPFVFEPESRGRTSSKPVSENPELDQRIVDEAKSALANGPLSTKRLLEQVTGNTNRKRPVLEAAADRGVLVMVKSAGKITWSLPTRKQKGASSE